uniref:Major facilitator superfamily (MFS) profile domain-containing protein n=1 Tax=Panagrolaimus superbus TaxID=310955 RepID=A0A914YT60_9BILA
MYNSTTSNETFGCNTDKFTWCQSLRPVNVFLYYISYIIALGFAFPIMNITTTTLFSKVLGPRRQGLQQGLFQVSGGVARMVGPIVISILYTSSGPRWAWHLEILVIGITLLFWFIFYRRMIPFQFKKKTSVPSTSGDISSTDSSNSDPVTIPVCGASNSHKK